MPERFTLKIIVTKQDACVNCPMTEMKGWIPDEQIEGGNKERYDTTTRCNLAELEEKLGRAPTVKEAENAVNLGQIYFDMIPEDCPNEYHGAKNLPIADRK